MGCCEATALAIIALTLVTSALGSTTPYIMRDQGLESFVAEYDDQARGGIVARGLVPVRPDAVRVMRVVDQWPRIGLRPVNVEACLLPGTEIFIRRLPLQRR